MALIKAETNGAGVTGNYWRIIKITPPTFISDKASAYAVGLPPGGGWSQGTLTFELYRDEAARKVELRTPLTAREISVPGSFFMGMTLVDDPSLVKRVIYERHGDIPGFEDAVPDFTPGDVTEPVDEETQP